MPEENGDAVTTEAEALADILAWSATRPLWQRDALRRLTEAEELTDQEIDDLADLCKDQTLAATPLSVDHVRAPDAGMPPVSLRAIRNALNVNALAGSYASRATTRSTRRTTANACRTPARIRTAPIG